MGVVSMDGERTENKSLEGKPGGRSKNGRPKFRWMIDVKFGRRPDLKGCIAKEVCYLDRVAYIGSVIHTVCGKWENVRT